MRLVISCMDYRLTEFLMRISREDDLIFRNAGADAYGIQGSLSALTGVSEILYLPHNDCAAHKLAFKLLKGQETASESIRRRLTAHLQGLRLTSEEELMRVNVERNVRLLKDLFPKASMEVKTVDVYKLNWPIRKPIVYYAKSTTRYSEDMIGAYLLQSTTKDDVSIDLEIALQKLGIREFREIENNEDQPLRKAAKRD
jgi:carbonic anhydrase